ncbi:MAG: TrkH family potassium uptake protein [Gammaproteobacteria bacterium]|nr:TrkH family potassium uptake protein [Gammaproteobacteria bacterium]
MRRAAIVARVIGVLLMLFSVLLLVPVALAVPLGEPTWFAFLVAFVASIGIGGTLWLVGRGRGELRARDGFLVTVLFYLGLGLVGALPFWLAPSPTVSFTDAAFESLSGLTTTGATVLIGLDDMPRSILLYRHLLQWLGGMGIIVLAVAVLPMLGVGGMQLYRSEAPSYAKDTKLTPRIAETAKTLWYIYIGLTAICAACYAVAGMGLFDAVCHALSTVAIGGFSTHDASMGHFDSVAIEGVAIVFMTLSGVNFALHFAAMTQRSLRLYARDEELRFYLAVLATVAVAVIATLLLHPGASDNPVREGLFQVVSVATTTGFTTADFSLWPALAPVLLLFAAFAGGCAGSTAGGLKQYRVLLICRQGLREVRRLIHPNGVFHIKLGQQFVPDRIVDAVWGFFAVYVVAFLFLLCVLLAVSELDFVTGFSAVAANLNNLGPGLGEVALNYRSVPDAGKWLLVVAMLLGRLEIFTLLVLLTPAYWRN